MTGFAEAVHQHFDFLIAEHGFTRGGAHKELTELGDTPSNVRYDGPHLFIWVHVDKNEVVVTLFVKVHTTILRPNVRRLFSLAEILQRFAPDDWKKVPQSVTPWSAPENYEDYLRFYADGLRRHCDSLLRMDLKMLEEVFKAK